MPRDIQPEPFPPLFHPLVEIASGRVHSVCATGRHVQAALQQGWLEQAVWQLLESAAHVAVIWREQDWVVPVSVHLSGIQLPLECQRRLQKRFPGWLAARGLAPEELLFEPALDDLLAPSPVEDLLDWYRLQDGRWTLARGDFICPPSPPWQLPQAVKNWQAHFQVMSAAANLPSPCPY